MKVTLKLNKDSRGRLLGGSIVVDRQNGPKIYSESAFWHQLKTELQKQGYDVIKKLMWKDGHLTDDNLYYVRSRKYTPDSFMISAGDSAIRFVYEDYNDPGVQDSLSVDASMEDEAAEKALARSQYQQAKKSRTTYRAGARAVKRASASADSGESGIGRLL